MITKELILEGKLPFPYKEEVESYYGYELSQSINRMWNALWRHFLQDKSPINSTYWAEQINNPKAFNEIVIELSRKGWINSKADPKHNWAEMCLVESKLLEYVDAKELANIIANKKHKTYMPSFDKSETIDITSVKGRKVRIGHTRIGFAKACQSQFYFDTDMLAKYQETIITNTNKGMSKVREMWPEMGSDSASYDNVATKIVQDLTKTPELFTMGSNYSDSRGRAIKSGLQKVFNPVGYKDARALLVIPK